MPKKYIVELTTEQRQQLESLIRKGAAPARMQTRARILLQVDTSLAGPAWRDTQVVEALGVGVATVERVRLAFVTEGMEVALQRRPRSGTPRRKLDGAQEARIIALACSTPPDGYARWSIVLLTKQVIALGIVDSIAPETIRQTLKKTRSSRG